MYSLCIQLVCSMYSWCIHFVVYSVHLCAYSLAVLDEPLLLIDVNINVNYQWLVMKSTQDRFLCALDLESYSCC